MPLELYLSYVVATIILLAIPGPTIILVITYALAHGWRATLGTVAGVGLGDATCVTLSLIGLGAVLSVSATLFTVLKWIGAIYLIWLGLKMWRAIPAPFDPAAASVAGMGELDRSAIFARTWFVTASNPKGIAFFVAFLPHFVVQDAPAVPQFFLLGATFVVLGVVNAFLYAVFASAVRRGFRSAGALTYVNRIGGTFLIGAGAMTAAIRRAG